MVFLKKSNIEKLFCYFCFDKLIYFLNNKIYLPIGNLSLYLLKLQFSHFGLLAWYITVKNQLYSGFIYLKIVGAFGTLHLDPTRQITLPSPIQWPMDPSYIENIHVYMHICMYIYNNNGLSNNYSMRLKAIIRHTFSY